MASPWRQTLEKTGGRAASPLSVDTGMCIYRGGEDSVFWPPPRPLSIFPSPFLFTFGFFLLRTLLASLFSIPCTLTQTYISFLHTFLCCFEKGLSRHPSCMARSGGSPSTTSTFGTTSKGTTTKGTTLKGTTSTPALPPPLTPGRK